MEPKKKAIPRKTIVETLRYGLIFRQIRYVLVVKNTSKD